MTKDLIEALVRCSNELFHARQVALDANRRDIVDELRHAQIRVNAALAMAPRDLEVVS